MRNRIMHGWPFTPEEQRLILEYCASDVDALCRLLPRILAEIESVIRPRHRAISRRVRRGVCT